MKIITDMIIKVAALSLMLLVGTTPAFQPGRQIGDNEGDPKQLNLLGF
jgi:hypothetical protein